MDMTNSILLDMCHSNRATDEMLQYRLEAHSNSSSIIVYIHKYKLNTIQFTFNLQFTFWIYISVQVI